MVNAKKIRHIFKGQANISMKSVLEHQRTSEAVSSLETLLHFLLCWHFVARWQNDAAAWVFYELPAGGPTVVLMLCH